MVTQIGLFAPIVMNLAILLVLSVEMTKTPRLSDNCDHKQHKGKGWCDNCSDEIYQRGVKKRDQAKMTNEEKMQTTIY